MAAGSNKTAPAAATTKAPTATTAETVSAGTAVAALAGTAVAASAGTAVAASAGTAGTARVDDAGAPAADGTGTASRCRSSWRSETGAGLGLGDALSDAMSRAASGEPFAGGREADVFLLDDVRVLRRYRYATDTTYEAQVMAYAASHGYPVPTVHAARGSDMVLERLHGPTMAQAALGGRVSLHEGAVILADLLRRLHELPPHSSRGADSTNDRTGRTRQHH